MLGISYDITHEPCYADSNQQIEFPSILLPPNISSGSIVDINVSRNLSSENASQEAFAKLQDEIFRTYGQRSPSPPVLRCRNATQTSVVLEWDPIQLATAQLRSLSLYRNGSKAGSIPRPAEIQCTKISGLAVDTEYTFHLVLRTSAGTYSSEKLSVRTHKMTDLSGITITPGVLPAPLRHSLSAAVQRIGAKMIDSVRIDTTHFVCTEGRGQPWEKAVEMNIPVVEPEWVEGCEREGRIVGVRKYYLDADPRLRQVEQGVGLHQPQRQQQQESRPTSDSVAQPRIKPVQQEQRQEPPSPQQSTEDTNSVRVDGPRRTESQPAPPAKGEGMDAETPTSEHTDGKLDSRRQSMEEYENVGESGGQRPKSSGEQRTRPTAHDEQRTPGDGNSFSEVQL